MMKILIVFGFIGLLYSCCTKEDCVYPDYQSRLYFSNFEKNDLDTVFVLEYDKDNHFREPIDSTAIFFDTLDVLESEMVFVKLENELDVTKEYKVVLSNREEYKVTGFALVKEKCNNCFPFTPNWDYDEILDHYTLNGVKTFKGFVLIDNTH